MTVHRPSSSSKPTGGKGGGASNKVKDFKQNKKRRERSSPSDHDTTTTTSTRLCIKNIPPSFTSMQLRDYLIKEYRQRCNKQELKITDCRVLMHSDKAANKRLAGKSRRIAFVGFQSPAMAIAVKQNFHQTFANTSKLIVEYARTYQQPSQHATEENNNNSKATTITKQKKKAEIEKEKESKTKKTPTATATAKNTKFWSNDLDLPLITAGSDDQKEEEEQPQQQLQQQQQQEDTPGAEDDDDKSTGSSNSTSSSSDSSEDEADPLLPTKTSKKAAGMSDLDFLKSKQKMVDNLNEEEEEEEDQQENDDNGKAKTGKGEADESSSNSGSSDDDSSSSSSSEDAQELPSRQQNKETPQEQEQHDEPDDDGDDDDDNMATSATSLDQNRLFIRNIPFSTTESELQDFFAQHGSIAECHIPVDDQKMSKGFGYVAYENHQDAATALQEMDGIDFQGRFLHVMLSRKQPQTQEQAHNDDDDATNQRPLSYKERQELIRRKKETTTTSGGGAKGWSASFVRSDAVVDSLADRLGIKKGDILNVKEGLSSGDAAVRLALGETQIIEENRLYFQNHGIDMEALVGFSPTTKTSKNEDNNNTSSKIQRSSTSLLVKNLPYDTQVDELNKIFHGVGGGGGGSGNNNNGPKRILLPPSRTIALVEYGHSSDAKRAFRKLAYRRFKNVPLYLEYAPIQALVSESESGGAGDKEMTSQPVQQEQEQAAHNEDELLPALEEGPTPSVYVKNLNFSTTEDKLKKFFEDSVGDVRAVKIPKKLAPIKTTKPGASGGGGNDEMMQSLSMGFGFVEFATHEAARKAITKLQGKLVDGHALELKPSTKSITTNQVKQTLTSSNKKNPTKITVRNVPFQASRTEILKLFGSFGQLKRVRLPKKFNGGHRGFAFVEFVTHKEALAAMKALSRTHLYGRHLVLEWAQDDDTTTTDSSSGGGGTIGVEGMMALREKAQRDVLAAGGVGGGGSDTRQANKRQKLW